MYTNPEDRGELNDLSDEDLRGRAAAANLDLPSYAECYESGRTTNTVQSSFIDGQQLGVTGTPTFFINGRMLVGSQNYDQLKSVIDEELGRTGTSS